MRCSELRYISKRSISKASDRDLAYQSALGNVGNRKYRYTASLYQPKTKKHKFVNMVPEWITELVRDAIDTSEVDVVSQPGKQG